MSGDWRGISDDIDGGNGESVVAGRETRDAHTRTELR